MDEQEWLGDLHKNVIMTAYVDIACSDMDKYGETAKECDVKLNIEEVFVTDENRKMDTIGVIGNQDKITKFIEKAKCNRIRIFHVKKGW